MSINIRKDEEDVVYTHTHTHIYIYIHHGILLGHRLPWWLSSKESDCDADAGDMGLIPGLGRSLEEGMATHFTILAWRMSWTEGLDRLWFMESQRVGHD